MCCLSTISPKAFLSCQKFSRYSKMMTFRLTSSYAHTRTIFLFLRIHKTNKHTYTTTRLPLVYYMCSFSQRKFSSKIYLNRFFILHVHIHTHTLSLSLSLLLVSLFPESSFSLTLSLSLYSCSV